MDRDQANREYDDQRDVEWLYREAERKEWERKQRAKAPEVLALLRAHIPADRRTEVDEFLLYSYGAKCLRDVLWCDLARTRLQAVLPSEHWKQIECDLDAETFGDLGANERELIKDAMQDMPYRCF